MNDFESLKPGDEVLYYPGYAQHAEIAKVDRMTKTLIVVRRQNMTGNEFDVRFNRETGWEVGCDKVWDRAHIGIPTDKHRAEIEERIMREKLKKYCNRVFLVKKESREPVISVERVRDALAVLEGRAVAAMIHREG